VNEYRTRDNQPGYRSTVYKRTKGMSQHPAVTVVIPVCNQAEFIQHALNSVYNQTCTGLDIVVVDDGSTDDTLSILRRNNHPNLTLAVHRHNLGQAHALNTGLRLVKTKYFIQLDGDDWLQPDTVAVMLEAMEQQPPDVSLAYGNRRIWWGGRSPKPGQVVKGWPVVDRVTFARKGITFAPRFYRTRHVQDVGGWDVDDPTGGRLLEDLRMMLKLLGSYRFLYIDHLLYNQRRHGRNLHQGTKQVHQLVEATIREYLTRWKTTLGR